MQENDIDDRAEMLDRARELVDWLEAHPEVPVDRIEARFSVRGEDDAAESAELERISASAGLPITSVDGGVPSEADHRYVRWGSFGDCVAYHAVAIPAEDMRRHKAMQSYSGCVEPERSTATRFEVAA